MTDNLKNAFDGIYAEGKLKKDTAAYIQKQLEKRGKQSRRFAERYSVAAALFAVIIFSGALSYNLYFTASAYVDFDVNPSLELTLNSLDRVIDVYAYNPDAQEAFTELSLKNKKYEAAIGDLIWAASQKGLLPEDGLVSITVQTKNANKETQMLSAIQSEITAAMAEHHAIAQVDVYPVNDDTRIQALQQNISPAKFLAIKELMDVDPSTTFEHCKGHSIRELKKLTQEYSGHHHGGDVNADSDNSYNSADSAGNNQNTPINNGYPETKETEDETPQNNAGQHGAKNGGSHHGGGHGRR